MVEDLSFRGLKARTTCEYEKDTVADIKLVSSYAAPVKFRARIAWSVPLEDEQSTYRVGFAISKVRIVDWFKFLRIISQIKKEMW